MKKVRREGKKKDNKDGKWRKEKVKRRNIIKRRKKMKGIRMELASSGCDVGFRI